MFDLINQFFTWNQLSIFTQVKERSDQEDDIVLVDGINPRNVNGADKKDKVEEERVVKKVEKEAVVENSGKVYI